MLFPIDSKPRLMVSLYGFDIGAQVVRMFEDHSHDNRIYVVQEQFGNYYCGRTSVVALHGDCSFMIDTTKLRPATQEEKEAHCRIFMDDDHEVTVLWGG